MFEALRLGVDAPSAHLLGNKDFRLDLLSYHGDLQFLVAIELKVDEFKPEHLAKLEFYLEAHDRNVHQIYDCGDVEESSVPELAAHPAWSLRESLRRFDKRR